MSRSLNKLRLVVNFENFVLIKISQDEPDSALQLIKKYGLTEVYTYRTIKRLESIGYIKRTKKGSRLSIRVTSKGLDYVNKSLISFNVHYKFR